MNFRAFLAAALCALSASPAPAQVRSAASAVRVPSGVSVVPALTPSLQTFAPSLNSVLTLASPVPALAPSLAAPSIATIKAAAAPDGEGLPLPLAVGQGPKAAAVAAALAPIQARSALTEPYGEGMPLPRSVERDRAEGEKFWSGAADQKEAELGVPVSAAAPSTTRRTPLMRGAALAPAAALAVPEWAASVAPYAKGGALLAGAWALNRGVRWGLDKLAAKKGWSKNTIAMARFVSALAVWSGAGVLGLSMAGVTGGDLAETFGVGGTAMALAISLAVKDVAGNLFHGVHFLLTRPFTVGDKVTIGKTTAVVRDLTLRYVVLQGEDGRDVLRTYSSLRAAPVTLYGVYQTKEIRLSLRRPALPHGLFRAIRDAAAPTLWKPIAFSAAGIAALAFFPMLGGLAAVKSLTWVAALLPYLKAGLVAFLASSISSALTRSLGRLGERYGWNPAVVIVAKLAATVATWLIGGSFLLNAVGVSWGWVAKTLSVGTALVTIAVSDYVTSIFAAGIVFRLKPFEIGDENVSIGEHTGAVVDITWQNVILRLDGDRYMIIPHSVVKDAEIKNPRKYGQRAEP